MELGLGQQIFSRIKHSFFFISAHRCFRMRYWLSCKWTRKQLLLNQRLVFLITALNHLLFFQTYSIPWFCFISFPSGLVFIFLASPLSNPWGCKIPRIFHYSCCTELRKWRDECVCLFLYMLRKLSDAVILLFKYCCLYAFVVGWPWLATRCPPSCSFTLPPQQMGEKIRQGRDTDRDITHHLLSWANQFKNWGHGAPWAAAPAGKHAPARGPPHGPHLPQHGPPWAAGGQFASL